jgi:hypothetical protein
LLASLPLAVPFPAKVCQLRVSQFWGSVQTERNNRLSPGGADGK